MLARRLSPIYPVLLLAALAWSPTGCSLKSGSTQPSQEPVRRAWTAELAFEPGVKLGGCAAGDLLAWRPGEEIAVVSAEGAVHLVYRDGETWRSRLLFQTPGELIQCAIGDVDPQTPGNEIVAVGMAEGKESRRGGPGAAYVIKQTANGWQGEAVLAAEALVHAACILDGAVLVAGYDKQAHRIVRAGDAWRAEKVADLPGPGKGAVAYKGGAAIACSDGSLVLLEPGAPWRVTVIHKREKGRSRVGTDGERILVSDDDGVLTLLTPGAVAWEAREIYKENDRLRGAVLADLDPARPGLEAATAGYEMHLSLLLPGPDGAWRPQALFMDTGRFHHLAAGEVDGLPGLELVGCGYSGRLVVLRLLPAR